MIKVENLVKTYPTKIPTLALRGVSLEIDHGEFVAIMGRSGSGKSTLLHQLSLLDTPTEGSIWIDRTDVVALNDAEKTEFRLKNLGYVFQEYALIVELTAFENVFLPAMTLGIHGENYKAHALELLNLVGVGHLKDRRPIELSGGEQQRVAIARALVNNPKIIFADEPTANLDSISSKAVLELFQKLQKQLGQTILMVTHEPEDISYVSRTIHLKDGMIDSLPTPVV